MAVLLLDRLSEWIFGCGCRLFASLNARLFPGSIHQGIPILTWVHSLASLSWTTEPQNMYYGFPNFKNSGEWDKRTVLTETCTRALSYLVTFTGLFVFDMESNAHDGPHIQIQLKTSTKLWY